MQRIAMTFQGYLVLLSTFTLNFVALGIFNSSGLYLGPLSTTFPNSDHGILAFYCTTQIVFALASSFVGGIAQDGMDQRGISLIFFGGGASMALGLILSSISSTLGGVLASSILVGVGIGLGGFMAGGICVLWFEKKRGAMLLLAMSGQGVGSMFFSWATGKLLEHYDEVNDPWRPTMRCMGMLCFILCVISAPSMRLPLPGEVETYEKNSDNRTDEGNSLLGDKSAGGDTQNMHHIDAERIRQSIASHHHRRRTSIAEFEAVGHAPKLPHISDFRRQKERLKKAVNAVIFAKRLSDLSSTDNKDAMNQSEYTLQEVLVSATNVWLNAFTVVSCFSIMNLQGMWI